MERFEKDNIPPQIRGKKLDITKQRLFRDPLKLKATFTEARNRLLHINNWADLVAGASSTFYLLDKTGQEVSRIAKEGDYVKIDIPGPGPAHGNGFDWVTITKIDERLEELYVMLTLKPAPPPDKPDSGKVAHFFKANASTTLVVKVEDEKLTVIYAGRNEEINRENDRSLDNIRNMFVGLGAKLGLSHPQWEKLVLGILGSEN
ncbi:hypothetical protein [Sphingobacterium bambusae]|uniref:Uncharacterized protein n=1 Tax=Sphingobacterium bambusae TaxID=662858 RepID=A0ABW6BDG6_9SPHI|nr:hypothetical protein [Sphingobacterium bambusae]WPL48499.1 hypothetical protein SCB77_21350 [Sphingobacterium bambusae]